MATKKGKTPILQFPLSEDIRIEYLALDEVLPWSDNPKDHDLGALIESFGRVGFVDPLVMNEGNGVLVAGHGRLEALSSMKDAGYDAPGRIKVVGDQWMVPVIRGIHFNSDGEAHAYAIASNKLVELGGWQKDRLSELLKSFAEEDKSLLGATGFDGDDLDELLADLQEKTTDDGEANDEVDLDKAGELQRTWKTEPGQLWLIESQRSKGRYHRLYCGDSTDQQAIGALLGDRSPSLVVTSPPYGVGKDYEEGGLAPWLSLMGSIVAEWKQHVPFWAVNLADIKVGPEHRELHTYGVMVDLFNQNNVPLVGTRIWSKQPCWATGPYWLSSYRAVDEFEYIGLFGKAAYKDRVNDDWRYRGIWEFPSVRANDKHPAMFPVELPRRLISLLSDPGDTIADPFMGSGTTLAAAESLGRLSVGMERDPKYLAVALQRAKDIGLEPKLLSSKEDF